MGVSGSGKTTIGRRVAAALDWPYFEADDFHSPANREKMARGEPLDDRDRAPWLAAIRAKMDACRGEGKSAVFTCSALKEEYRATLCGTASDVVLVFLHGSFEMIQARVAHRQGHFLKSELVRSQFETLEPPKDALTLDVASPPAEIVEQILARLGTVRENRSAAEQGPQPAT